MKGFVSASNTTNNCLNGKSLLYKGLWAEALSKIGQVDISLTLSRLLPDPVDPSPYARAMMALPLGELQDERAADSIGKFLHDENERLPVNTGSFIYPAVTFCPCIYYPLCECPGMWTPLRKRVNLLWPASGVKMPYGHFTIRPIRARP